MAAGAPGGSHWEDSFCSRTGCCSETFAAQGWSSCAAEPAASQQRFRRLLQHRDGAAVLLNRRRASNDFCSRSWFLGMSADIAGCSNCLIRMVFCEVTVTHRCTVTLILLTYLWIEPIQMFNSFMLESPVFNWLCCFLELPINVLHCKRAGVRSRTACSIS